MIRDLVQFNQLSQVRKVTKQLFDATIISLEELSQHQTRKQLVLGEHLWTESDARTQAMLAVPHGMRPIRLSWEGLISVLISQSITAVSKPTQDQFQSFATE